MTPDLKSSILLLFRECFEGIPEGQEYTWFVEGKEGIFDALESTTHDRASIRPSFDCPSIAAHAYHIRYALRGANSYIGGPAQQGDWDSSWVKQTVSYPEWVDLKQDIKKQYDFFLAYFESNVDFPDQDSEIGFVAQLPHMAFHLGALRQLIKIV